MTPDIHLMRMISYRRAAIALMATIIAAPMLPAQVSGPKMIPTVLARAMLGDFGEMMGGIVFVVGKSPDRWPKSLIAPAQARIVGGGKFGPILTTVYEYPSQGDAAGSFESLLLKTGFKKAEARGFSRQQGFASSTGSAAPHSFCGDAGAVGFQQVDSTKTVRTIAVVFVADKESSSTCSTRPQNDPAALKLPSLRPPAGVNVTPGGTGSSSTNLETSARVDTTLSVDEVLAHYVKQLVAGGWKAARSPVVGEGVALQEVSARDDRGEEWSGALVVMTSHSQRNVTLRMLRDEER
jgi:hypothetical protein